MATTILRWFPNQPAPASPTLLPLIYEALPAPAPLFRIPTGPATMCSASQPPTVVAQALSLQQNMVAAGPPLSGGISHTVHVEEKINANAGSGLTGCTHSVPLLGNATGAGTGLWTVIDGPAGAPTIASPGSQSTAANATGSAWRNTASPGISLPTWWMYRIDTRCFNIALVPVTLTDFAAKEATSVD